MHAWIVGHLWRAANERCGGHDHRVPEQRFLCMGAGARVRVTLLRPVHPPMDDLPQAAEESAAHGKFTFWFKVFDSIGGCWVVIFRLSVIMTMVWVFFLLDQMPACLQQIGACRFSHRCTGWRAGVASRRWITLPTSIPVHVTSHHDSIQPAESHPYPGA
jgi:hypothetical protein